MVSGGFRPDAPQNNPANVSGVGGAGQSGDYKGFAYGENKAVNTQRVEGNQAVATTKAANIPSSEAAYGGVNMSPLGTFFDPTRDPMEPISAGVDFGRGPGSEALPKNFQNNTRPDENAEIIKNYLPDLAFAAQSKDAPDSFKRLVNFLMEAQ